MSVPLLTWLAIRLSILSFVVDGSSRDVVAVLDVLPSVVPPDFRLASIESSALVSAVASVEEIVPAEASLLISEATLFLVPCACAGLWVACD